MNEPDADEPKEGTPGASAGEDVEETVAVEASRRPDRFPPPFFPPGSDRRERRRAALSDVDAEEEALAFPEDAFIQPDDPLGDREEGGEDEEPVVTGMGGEEHPVPPETAEPAVAEVEGEGEDRVEETATIRSRVARELEALARELEEEGGVVLQPDADAGSFELMLRGLVAGFLAREE